MASIDKSIGSINEKGYLAGFTRRGFTPAKCLLELYANSLDSLEKVHIPANFTKKIVADVKSDKSSLIDNGAGMLLPQVDAMFDLHQQNHTSDTSRGVSGIGAKPAMSILSENTTVNVFTHAVGGPYIRVSTPWSEIHSKGVWGGMTKVGEMTDAEKAAFIKDRTDNGMLNMNEAHGTTIQFKTNDTLSNILEATFAKITDECALKNQLDRAGIVFGRDQVEFLYKNQNKPGVIERLDQYDYFGAPSSQFYTGKTEHIVEQWHSDKEDKDRFILDYKGKKYEVTQSGRGFSKDPEELKNGTTGYQKVGSYKIVCGMRIDTTVFDPESPVTISGKFTPGAFNVQHIGSDPLDSKEFLWSMKLIRNNQLIGLIPNPTISLGSMRANDDAQIAGALVQAEIQFNPISSQDNHQDRVTGIQENKNQFDGKGFPIPLARIAGFLRSEKAKDVSKFMHDCTHLIGEESEEDERAEEQRIQKEKEALEKKKAEQKEALEKKALEKKKAEEALEKKKAEETKDDTEDEEDCGLSENSEEEYVTGDDITAWIHDFYDTITPDQKFTRADVVKLFANAPRDLFAV